MAFRTCGYITDYSLLTITLATFDLAKTRLYYWWIPPPHLKITSLEIIARLYCANSMAIVECTYIDWPHIGSHGWRSNITLEPSFSLLSSQIGSGKLRDSMNSKPWICILLVSLDFWCFVLLASLILVDLSWLSGESASHPHIQIRMEPLLPAPSLALVIRIWCVFFSDWPLLSLQGPNSMHCFLWWPVKQ